MKKTFLSILIIFSFLNFFIPVGIISNGKIQSQKIAYAEEDCTILSAVWVPAGEQADDFYKEKETTAHIIVKSKNCVNKSNINLSIYEGDGIITSYTDDVWNESGLYQRVIAVPSDDFTIRMLLGEEDCANTAGGEIGFDCDLYFKINKGASTIYNSPDSNSGGWLWYECEGLSCLENAELLEIIPNGTNEGPVVIDPQQTQNLTNDYNLLAPIGNFKVAPKNIGDYFNTIFKIVIGLCGALAVVMIVIGGVQYMGDESIFGKTEAKSKITSAIFGLIIALGSYALLNTINPDLLGGKGVKINSVSAEIDPDVHGDIPQSSAVNGKYCNGRVVDGAEIDTVTNRKWKEDQTERTILNNAGITIQRSSSCQKVGEKNCTSLTGLDTSKIITFKNKCSNCVVVINGATECWNHSQKTQHYPGNSIVDIDDTSSVNGYIKTGTKTRDSKNTYDIYEKDGMKFLDEGNHYHVLSW